MRYIILFLLATILLPGCSRHRYDGELALVDSLQKVDSAYLPDSLLQPIVSYYDRYGSRNQQVRAHYLLGRTYHIEGLLPQALDAYQTAAERADTTARDCDYSLLMKVYSQMHEVFSCQRLPNEALRAIDKMEQYALLAKDTSTHIISPFARTRPFYMLGFKDSVLHYANKSYKRAVDMGRPDNALVSIGATIPILLEQGKLEEAKEAMDAYESCQFLFDSEGNISHGMENYYYSKGMYFLQCNQQDSAEFYFRKELRDGKDYNNQIAGTHGLSLIYERLHLPDSAYKYAQLSYEFNDSAYSLSVAENLQQMQAAYDYRIHEKLAAQKTTETEKMKLWIYVLLLSIVIASLILAYGIKKRREKVLRRINFLTRHSLDLEDEMSRMISIKERAEEELKQQSQETSRKIEALQQQIDELNQHLSKNSSKDLESAFYNSEIFDLFNTLRKIRVANQTPPTEKNWNLLENTFKKYFCNYYNFITVQHHLSESQFRLCVLMRLGFRDNEIGLLMAKDSKQISKLKSLANHSLFECSDAKSLRENLKRHFS